MEYEIHTECIECDGYGIIETRVSVDRYSERDCADCDGSGLIMHTEIYDSEEDAKADYPESFIRGTKWTAVEAGKRADMIVRELGLLP